MKNKYLFCGMRFDNGELVYGAAFQDDNGRHYIITEIVDKSHIVRGAMSEHIILHWVDPATIRPC